MNNVIIRNFTQKNDIKKPQELLSYKEILCITCIAVSLLSIILIFPTLLVIILILLLFIAFPSFIGFITALMSKDPIREKICWFLSLLISGTLTIWCISAIVNTGYYTVKPEEITFLGNPENHNEIKELPPGDHFLPLSKNLLRNLYIFPQKETYNWNLSIRPNKDALLQKHQESKYFFKIQLIFEVNLTNEKALELLITHKSDLATMIEKIAMPNIQTSLNQLSQTLSLSNFSNQKEQIEKAIAAIINKELNSAGLSEYVILWLKLEDSPKQWWSRI
jgi:hypothetical protein